MTNVLIIGNGVHAVRYLETYLFCDYLRVYFYEYNKDSLKIIKKYGANKETTLDILDKYDVIFLALPIDERKNVFDRIVSNKYKGIVLIEKPLAMCYLEGKELLDKINNFQLAVIYNRQFEDKIDFIQQYYQSKLIIRWPNLSKDHIDPITNTMANVLDTLFIICGYKSIRKIHIEQDKNNYRVSFVLNNVSIEIEIFDTDNLNDKVTINDKVLEWPNYFETNLNIIEKILSGKYDYKSNQKKALMNAKALEKIVRYLR